MTYRGQTAFVTGGASGIARALCQHLVEEGASVFIADVNLSGAEKAATELNNLRPNSAFFARCDVTSWDELTSVFSKALEVFDRIDYVFPIAGLTERQLIPKRGQQQDVRKEGFTRPNHLILETNLMGMINLSLIAVQAFRGQEAREELGGHRGKIVCVASTCALYAINSIPSYTASKHGIAGFVRSYGRWLPIYEQMTINAICPHVVRTGIRSTGEFYDDLQAKGLLTDMKAVIAGFDTFLGKNRASGDCLEVGPRGTRVVDPVPFLDDATQLGAELIEQASGKLWLD